MPRKSRFNLPGIPQHVIQRGNNRNPCFFSEADYFHYLDDLIETANRQTRLGKPGRPGVEEEDACYYLFE